MLTDCTVCYYMFIFKITNPFTEHILLQFHFHNPACGSAWQPLGEQWQSSINIFGLASHNLATERCSCAKPSVQRAQS